MAVDWDKPIRTSGGQPARLLGSCRLRPGQDARVVAIDYGHEGEVVRQYFEDGTAVWVACQIVNVPEKHVRWVNMYAHTGFVYATREDAEERANDKRIACIRFEFEEGEGL